jgi:hypothetical protein
MVYPALLPLMRTHRLPVVDWTDAPADLHGLVLFPERRNLVSVRVPSHFRSSLPTLKGLGRSVNHLLLHLFYSYIARTVVLPLTHTSSWRCVLSRSSMFFVTLVSQILAATIVFLVLKGACYFVPGSGRFFSVSDSGLDVTSLVCCKLPIAWGLDSPFVFLHMTGLNTTERIGIITSLRTGRPMNCGSIWGRSQRFVSPPYTHRKDLKRT